MVHLFRNTHFQSSSFFLYFFILPRFSLTITKKFVFYSCITCKLPSLIFQFLNVSLSPGSACASTGIGAILISIMPVTHHYAAVRTIVTASSNNWLMSLLPRAPVFSPHEAELIDLNSKGNSEHIWKKKKKTKLLLQYEEEILNESIAFINWISFNLSSKS